MPPSIGESLPETSEGRDKTRYKNGVPTTQSLVQGLSEPAADEGTAYIGGSCICR
jgi:hypothetical protein